MRRRRLSIFNGCMVAAAPVVNAVNKVVKATSRGKKSQQFLGSLVTHGRGRPAVCRNNCLAEARLIPSSSSPSPLGGQKGEARRGNERSRRGGRLDTIL